MDNNTTQILVVEDEILVQMFLVDLLEDFGYRSVDSAAHADAAMEKASLRPPSIALVDVTLGSDKDGVWVAQQLSSQFQTKIIFMSGYDDIDQDDRVKALGPVAVIRKPCSPDVLENALREATSA